MEGSDNLLKEIEENITRLDKPSTYLNNIKEKLKNTPLEILLKLEKTEQNPKFHPEGNVWNHMLEVVDTASKIKEYANDKASLMLAALLHDVGKATTTKKNKQGRLISYNHDTEGKKIVEDILNYYDYDEKCKERILSLVRYHMHHLYILKDLPFGKAEEMIKEVDLNDMILMFVSDRLGRGQREKGIKLKEIDDIQSVITILEDKYSLDLQNIRIILEKISNNI